MFIAICQYLGVMVHFHIISLFSNSIEPYLQSSIIGRAREGLAPKGKKNGKPLIKISYYDPKDFTTDKYGRVDRRPYGGGPGMVLEPDAILRAVEAAKKKAGSSRRSRKLFCLRQMGKSSVNRSRRNFSKKKDIVMICGRYEGIDARVLENISPPEADPPPAEKQRSL
jgi:tRNA (guanine37-N1)-methyltransferase